VFAMEESKKKNKSDLMAKGVSEFLAEIKNDDLTRPKALIQYGIDEKRIVFNGSQSKFYLDETELCFVPFDKQSTRQDFLSFVLRKPENKDKWQAVLKTLIDAEYVNKLDKYGARWVASQLDVPLNQKEDQLRDSLLALFAVE
jgi:hypothetical protein